MNERLARAPHEARKVLCGLTIALWVAMPPAARAEEPTQAQPPPATAEPSAQAAPVPATTTPTPAVEQIGNPQIEQIEQIESPQVANLWLDPQAYPHIERAINVMNARTTRAHALNFVVDHRTFQPFQTHSFNDWAG